MTNLGRDGAFEAAQLLDGTVEIVPVAFNNAHYKLQVRLHTTGKLNSCTYVV